MPTLRVPPTRGMNRKPKRVASQPELIRAAEDSVSQPLEFQSNDQAAKRCAVAHSIRICEDRRTDTGFVGRLSIDGGPAYPIAITNPANRCQDEALQASFDSWESSHPTTDGSTPDAADCGRDLFDQIFVHERSRNDYRALTAQLSQTQIEVVGPSPAFHDLHWEALRDPELPRPLAVDCQIVHKSGVVACLPDLSRPSPVMNLLVVTSRPRGDWGIGCHSVARQLVEAAGGTESRINVEFLRPSTFEALSEELRARELGFYHMIHFDCPVALLDYEEACTARGASGDSLEPQELQGYEFQGVREFLVMEGDERVDFVDANELVELLVESGVPICVLNVWRAEGRPNSLAEGQEDESKASFASCKTSLAWRLMDSGVPTVVAINYPMATSATQILMQTLCSQLLAQHQVAKALQLGRQALFKQVGRWASSDLADGMEDWMRPVVYENQPVSLKLLDFRSPVEQEDRVGSPSCSGRFAMPTYGFVGRESEIRDIECALSQHNFLMLKGKAGTGKTALLMYLREWWLATKFARRTLYFGYIGRPWTLQQILFEIMQRLYREAGRRHVQALGEQEQLEVLTAKLRCERCALLFDSLEPVLAGDATCKGMMDSEEKAKICSFLKRLVHGETMVVLCSGSGNDWLAGGNELCGNVHELEGLNGKSRLVLAEKILQRHLGPDAQVAQLLQGEDADRLLTALAGYPLLMEVALPNLKWYSPAETLATLDVAAVDATSGVLSCMEGSFRCLPQKKQQQLLLLAPFEGFLAWDSLDMYIAELRKLEFFRAFDFEAMNEAVQDAIDLGLLSPVDADDNCDKASCLAIERVFTCFLKTVFSQQEATMVAAMREGFQKYYQWCSTVYLKLMRSQERERGIKLCEMQYRNLNCALEVCLEDKGSMAIANCLHVYFELKGDSASGLKLAHLMCEAQSRSIEMGAETLAAQEWLARWYLVVKDFRTAMFTYQSILAIYRCMEGDSKEVIHGLGVTYHQIGLVAQELKELKQARKSYKRALDIFSNFDDRQSKASTYYQLGVVAQEAGNFDEARRIYLHALEIFVDFDDMQSQVNIHHQLAGMAEVGRDFHEAYRNYQMALEVCARMGDRHAQAMAYHHLGIASQEMGNFAEARESYQKALDIFIEYDDRHSQASTYHQLGRVSQELCQFDEARRTYEQALKIFVEFDDSNSQAHTYHQLGSVAEKLKDFDEAQKNYKQALQMGAGSKDRLSQATTYHHLGVVAQHSRIFDEATRNYEEAIKILQEFGDRRPQANTYHQLGIVAQELRKFDDARRDYLRALEIYVEFGDRRAQADTYYQLGMVAQELRGFEEAHQKFHQAMEIYQEFNDRPGQASAHQHLGSVAQELQDLDEARLHYMKALAIYIELNDRHSQASTYFLLGHLDEMEHSYVHARENVRKGLVIFEELKDARVVAIATRWLRRMEISSDSNVRRSPASSRQNNRYSSCRCFWLRGGG